MILPLAAFAALFAGASAQIDYSCLGSIASYADCAAMLSGNCAEGQTLFEVLDPREICVATTKDGKSCKDGLISGTASLDAQGCCTSNSLYPMMAAAAAEAGEDAGNCSTSQELSYEGFSQVLSYFCEAQTFDSTDFYCITDGQDYLVNEVGPAMMALLTEQITPAEFNAAVDCTKIQATQCCYPSMREFVAGCGGDSAETQQMLGQLDNFLALGASTCMETQSVAVDLTAKCPGLTEIEKCFASEDPNCTGDDDDAAVSVMPTFASAFAAALGFLFFARQF